MIHTLTAVGQGGGGTNLPLWCIGVCASPLKDVYQPFREDLDHINLFVRIKDHRKRIQMLF
jgi:hypothetical protein